MTFSEWCIDKKNKAKKFYTEHKTGCHIVIGSICLIVVGGISYAIGKNVEENNVAIPDDIWDKIESNNNDNDNDDSKLSTNWSEEYREGWNAVNELANSINLKDGESYIIERNNKYSDKPIVSHMIYDTGVYPPDEN